MTEELEKIEFDKDSKQKIDNTESTVHGIHEDLKDVGDAVDYSKMGIGQLRDEFRKFRKEHDNFRWEIKKTIHIEIEKQILPLLTKLNEFEASKSKIVYIEVKSRSSVIFRVIRRAIVFPFKKLFRRKSGKN